MGSPPWPHTAHKDTAVTAQTQHRHSTANKVHAEGPACARTISIYWKPFNKRALPSGWWGICYQTKLLRASHEQEGLGLTVLEPLPLDTGVLKHFEGKPSIIQGCRWERPWDAGLRGCRRVTSPGVSSVTSPGCAHPPALLSPHRSPGLTPLSLWEHTAPGTKALGRAQLLLSLSASRFCVSLKISHGGSFSCGVDALLQGWASCTTRHENPPR